MPAFFALEARRRGLDRHQPEADHYLDARHPDCVSAALAANDHIGVGAIVIIDGDESLAAHPSG